MAKEHIATLNFSNSEFILGLHEEGENFVKQPRTILTDNDLYEILFKVSKVLDFNNLEEMLIRALEGDETAYLFDHDVESVRYFDIGEIKSFLERQVKGIDKSLSKELQIELEQNIISDIAASCIETASEIFAYKVLSLLQNLAIFKLEVNTIGMKNFSRLINLFNIHAGHADIEVKLVS